MANWQDLSVFAGESRTLNLLARDASNNPQDLAGQPLTWRVGLSVAPDVITPILEKTFPNAVAPGDLVFVNNNGGEIDFTTTAGAFDIEWMNTNTVPAVGFYQVSIDPWDTMGLAAGNYIYTGLTVASGEEVFVSNDSTPLQFITNTGSSIEWLSDSGGGVQVVSNGTFCIRRSTRR